MNGSIIGDGMGNSYELQVFNHPDANGAIRSTLMINSFSSHPVTGVHNLQINSIDAPPQPNIDLEDMRASVMRAEAQSNTLRAEVNELKEVIQKLVDIRKVTTLTARREDR